MHANMLRLIRDTTNTNEVVHLFLEERENRSTQRKALGAEKRTNKLNPHIKAGSENPTRATLVGGECSHHCATPAPQFWGKDKVRNNLNSHLKPGSEIKSSLHCGCFDK